MRQELSHGIRCPLRVYVSSWPEDCHNALRNAVPPAGTSPHNGTVTTYGRSRDSQRSVYGISAYYRRNGRDVPRRRIPHNGIHPDMGSGVVIPLLSADGRNRRVSLPRSHIPHNRTVGRLGRGNNHIGPSVRRGAHTEPQCLALDKRRHSHRGGNTIRRHICTQRQPLAADRNTLGMEFHRRQDMGTSRIGIPEDNDAVSCRDLGI